MHAPTDQKSDAKRIGELEDEIKHRDKRIEELRDEIDRQREVIQKYGELVRRFDEYQQETDNLFDNWRDTFDMVLNDDGTWSWGPWWDDHNKLVDDWNKLVSNWNRYLPLINGTGSRNVGRPLLASEAQCVEVLKRHKVGESLRGIAEEMTLGVNTVRTIIAKAERKDRTTKKHKQRAERIELDRMVMARRKRKKRTGDALPRQVQRVIDQGEKLIKEAKGLGRA
jgi:hypothetical protein